MSSPQAAYIHVPFCRHRCGYCNFTLVAGRDDLIAAYLDALERELQQLAQPRPVRTVFFGGGTPTHLPPAQLSRLLTLARHWFPWPANAEVSVEANPSDLDDERLAVLAAAGVTRLSIGVQSWNAAKLAVLERDHSAEIIEQAVRRARPMFRSISLDLIFGVAGETRSTWQKDVARTVQLAPDHVSTYGLTYERGTSFWTRRAKGSLHPVSEDDELWMYEHAIDTLAASGWQHYEVSNFARLDHRCQHNEVYWNGEEYYAAGPGAARYVDGTREMNHRSTTTYIKRLLAGQSPVAERETLGPEDRARERLVFGLRRLEGIDVEDFAQQMSFTVEQLGGKSIARFLSIGLLQQQDKTLSLTRKGLLVSDSLWPELL
ncbi:MAG: radical SAM family heme chaperone HemW [Planctomycetales bacterium]|nr:radical SAM family heme chaperone HemW [Planctomycetales bacterium]